MNVQPSYCYYQSRQNRLRQRLGRAPKGVLLIFYRGYRSIQKIQISSMKWEFVRLRSAWIVLKSLAIFVRKRLHVHVSF